MECANLSAQTRGTGKYVAREMRENGEMPAVIYGNGIEPLSIKLNGKEMKLIYQKYSTFISSVFEIEVNGDRHKVLVRDYQLHPVTDELMHIDFQVIPKEKTQMKIKVALFFMNSKICPGAKSGGILVMKKRSINVMCDTDKIQNEIKNDVIHLKKDEKFSISDIKFPEGMTPVFYRDALVARMVSLSGG